jgi:hypothetical protein
MRHFDFSSTLKVYTHVIVYYAKAQRTHVESVRCDMDYIFWIFLCPDSNATPSMRRVEYSSLLSVSLCWGSWECVPNRIADAVVMVRVLKYVYIRTGIGHCSACWNLKVNLATHPPVYLCGRMLSPMADTGATTQPLIIWAQMVAVRFPFEEEFPSLYYRMHGKYLAQSPE